MSYDPTLGRWTRQDPAGYVNGANLYEAYGSNPVTRSDPEGLDWTYTAPDGTVTWIRDDQVKGDLVLANTDNHPQAHSERDAYFQQRISQRRSDQWPDLRPDPATPAMQEIGNMASIADAWNKASPGWRTNNQCAEQAARLANHLIGSGLWKHWNIGTEERYTGAKFSLLGLFDIGFAYHHNVVVLTPKNENPHAPLVLDPFKHDRNHWPVRIESYAEFTERYPNASR